MKLLIMLFFSNKILSDFYYLNFLFNVQIDHQNYTIFTYTYNMLYSELYYDILRLLIYIAIC